MNNSISKLWYDNLLGVDKGYQSRQILPQKDKTALCSCQNTLRLRNVPTFDRLIRDEVYCHKIIHQNTDEVLIYRRKYVYYKPQGIAK